MRKKILNRIDVRFEMLKFMKDREVAIASHDNPEKIVRGLYIKSLKYLDLYFNMYNVLEENKNVYISVSRYRNIPAFTYNLRDRAKETIKWFDNDANNQRYDFDIVIDFDNLFEVEESTYNNLDEKIRTKRRNKYFLISNEKRDRDLKMLMLDLHIYNVPYYVIPTGNNYQIHIDNYRTLSHKQIMELLEKLKSMYISIDLSGYSNPTKLQKCPFTVADGVFVYPCLYGESMITDYDRFKRLDLFDTGMIRNKYEHIKDVNVVEAKYNLAQYYAIIMGGKNGTES